MNGRNISLSVIFLLILSGIVGAFFFINKSSSTTLQAAMPNPLMKRQIVQVPLNSTNQPSVEASKLPQFIFSLADSKFASILNTASDQLDQLAKAKIVNTVYGAEVDATVSVDKDKKELLVSPQDIPNFKPGLYKLSLTLRTVQGVVNINQDFTWGVIAVNTNKSIYRPGETAKIGLGVLDDKGNTLCATGLFDKVDALTMVVIDPDGNKTNFSLSDNTIKDSGQCGPTTVTNEADFQSTYQTGGPGIYQMKVTAVVYGKTRQIQDYFKVDPAVQFDVERTSFPTRIYPGSPYPVTLTVTAKQNYQGTVEDIVPAFFGIEHIDGGQTVKDGNFTKIVWNANLTAGQPQTFTYFIRFPRVSPEFYLIGPLKIGDFHEARQWEIASDAINSNTGVFTAEDNGSSNTWYRIWTGTTWNPAIGTNPNSISNTPTDSRWFKEASSPLTGEKIVALEDNNNSTGATAADVYVFRWSGSAWTQDVDINMTITNASSQYMDVGYNQQSGNAMLVFCDSGQTQIHYLIYTASSHTWDHSGTLANSSLSTAVGTSTSQKTWVRIVPQANSDNMLVGYLDTSNFVGGFIFDGDNKTVISGSELVDNAGTTASGHAHEAFSMAWETSNQVPMLMWGTGATSIIYRRFTGGAWSAEASTGLTGFAANVDWVSAASDDVSNSNNIAIATQNVTATTTGCGFAVWDGSSWTKYSATTPTCANDGVSRSSNVIWEHGTGKAVWVFVPSGASDNTLNYDTWQSSSFGTIAALSGTAPAQIRSVQLYSDANTVSIMCLYDSVVTGTNEAAYDVEWNGTSWTSLPASGNSLFANVGNSGDGTPEEAFGFGFDLNLEMQAAYRWFNNLNIADGGSTLTALTAQDTSYTLTTANQAFRLRMLIYYPDQLPTSQNRQYDLQYVDPGGGTCASPTGGTPSTWTNVPTSGGQINFNNNSLLNSGDNIATNAADPTFNGLTTQYQDYQESNTFTNSRTNILGNQTSIWDFSLIDNTTFDRTAQTFCFRIVRDNGGNPLPLRVNIYPTLNTAALNDVQVQGGTLIQGNTMLQ